MLWAQVRFEERVRWIAILSGFGRENVHSLDLLPWRFAWCFGTGWWIVLNDLFVVVFFFVRSGWLASLLAGFSLLELVRIWEGENSIHVLLRGRVAAQLTNWCSFSTDLSLETLVRHDSTLCRVIPVRRSYWTWSKGLISLTRFRFLSLLRMVGARFECAFLKFSFLFSHAPFSIRRMLSCDIFYTIVIDHSLKHLSIFLSVTHLCVSESYFTRFLKLVRLFWGFSVLLERSSPHSFKCIAPTETALALFRFRIILETVLTESFCIVTWNDSFNPQCGLLESFAKCILIGFLTLVTKRDRANAVWFMW